MFAAAQAAKKTKGKHLIGVLMFAAAQAAKKTSSTTATGPGRFAAAQAVQKAPDGRWRRRSLLPNRQHESSDKACWLAPDEQVLGRVRLDGRKIAQAPACVAWAHWSLPQLTTAVSTIRPSLTSTSSNVSAPKPASLSQCPLKSTRGTAGGAGWKP